MINKKAILLAMPDLPAGKETEWNKWLETDHIAKRIKLPGFISGRLFNAIEGHPNCLCLYDLESADVLLSDGYLKLRDKEDSLRSGPGSTSFLSLPHFFRGLYEQIYPEQGEYQIPNTKFILAVGHDGPPNREEELNAWYNTEHIPAMKRVPGFMSFRRFKAVEAESFSTGKYSETVKKMIQGTNATKYLAVYDLDSDRVLQSEAYLRERKSAWADWVLSWSTSRTLFLGRLI
jgi:hypothetical protein